MSSEIKNLQPWGAAMNLCTLLRSCTLTIAYENSDVYAMRRGPSLCVYLLYEVYLISALRRQVSYSGTLR